MATLLLTAVGTALGGPIGGAIGALVGQQADRAIFGSGSADGPRLKELSVTTSSYGQPIARVFGRMRVPGTVIWSTELIESSQKTGGGKGKPSTTTYSYSASFAVALSSTPIDGVGRIWADGNLLRGSGGDLKVEGELRTYQGFGDDPIDPLIAASQGSETPAFRDCAYVVFEDLQLADFGNRIPALTFEILEGAAGHVSLQDLVPQAHNDGARDPVPYIKGFADEGGPVVSALSGIDRLFPLACVTTGAGLSLKRIGAAGSEVPELAPRLAEHQEQSASGRYRSRAENFDQQLLGIRYYDEARDYQPSVQRAHGSRSSGRENILDLPATLAAEGARLVANDNALRARWGHEKTVWSTVEIDPTIEPGSIVRVPGAAGYWEVEHWEWLDRGLELGLTRLAPYFDGDLASDAGTSNLPIDEIATPTLLRAFEVPSNGRYSPAEPLILAAASSENAAWRGASLYVEQGSALIPIGPTGPLRSTVGLLVDQLPPSNSATLEQNATVVIDTSGANAEFFETTVAGLASGSNRMLIGSEIVQFLKAEPLGSQQWRLSGLLRGRGGTEDAAIGGHMSGTSAVLLDSRITELDTALVTSHSSTRIAAVGLGDDSPVYAQLSNAGLSRRPPMPVHVRSRQLGNGSMQYCWTRRARGQWAWDDNGNLPLVEERELYLVGLGATDNPSLKWLVEQPMIEFASADLDTLIADHGPNNLWVQQVGTYSNSAATKLAHLS